MAADGDRVFFRRLSDALGTALADRADGSSSPVVLFSGGVDSALLAHRLRHRRGLRLFTIGLPTSPDLAAAESGARALGQNWTGRSIPVEVALRAAEEWRRSLGGASPTARAYLVALALAVRLAPPGPLFLGQGADELFFGYAHYRGLPSDEAAERARADRIRWLDVDHPRLEALVPGRRLVCPYLDPGFVFAAESVPIERRHTPESPKAFFRAWARSEGVPAEIADRRKRAIQYGTGIERALRKAADDPRRDARADGRA